MSDEGLYGTFDPFAIVQDKEGFYELPGDDDPRPIPEREERNIMMDREGFLAGQGERSNFDLAVAAHESNSALTEESRRSFILEKVTASFYTDNAEDLLATLQGVEAWLTGTPASSAGEAESDDHPSSGVGEPDEAPGPQEGTQTP